MTYIRLVGLCIGSLFILGSYTLVHAQTPSDPAHPNPNIRVTFNGIPIEDNGTYPLAGVTGTFVIEGGIPSTRGALYFYHESDHVLVSPNVSAPTSLGGTGVYTLVIIEDDLSLVQSPLQRFRSFFLPSVYAAAGDITHITFTVTEPTASEPEVDPLIVQYAPVLYFHPQEDYFPMDVQSFVKESALWATIPLADDLQLYASSTLTFNTFEAMVSSGVDTSDLYLAFSDPDSPRTIDLENAKEIYNNIKKDTPTVYYHKTTDTTDYGKVFTVLQYWYFYAMNNWKEQVDGVFTNNHEGDWESVFVFLDDETKEPEYVAFSSHLNDGNPDWNPKQYDSVRRRWDSDDVVKEEEKVVSFVALGSHANYPNDNGGIHFVSSPVSEEVDQTSLLGLRAVTDMFKDINENITVWDEYQGKWGTDTTKLGWDGPQGPRFIDLTGQVRFSQPLQWAGIDRIIHTTLDQETLEVLFPEEEVSIVFNVVIPTGTTFGVSPHDEVITFGIVPSDSTLLPHFWDIDTSYAESTYAARLTLPYNLEEIQARGYTEEDIVGAYYDPLLNTWSYFPATFDSTTQTATFEVSHFSRYALALRRTVQVEEILDTSASSTADVSESIAPRSHAGRRIKRPPSPQVLGVSTTVIHTTQLAQIETLVARIGTLLEQQESLTNVQKQVLIQILQKVAGLLEGLVETP